jgi:hypothetical protein
MKTPFSGSLLKNRLVHQGLASVASHVASNNRQSLQLRIECFSLFVLSFLAVLHSKENPLNRPVEGIQFIESRSDSNLSIAFW